MLSEVKIQVAAHAIARELHRPFLEETVITDMTSVEIGDYSIYPYDLAKVALEAAETVKE